MKTIDWESLTFANNYVFQEVLKNKELCKYLIERILHIQIKDIRYLIAERHINSARISSKSIRLDVYVENQEGTVLDIEMQVTGDKCEQRKGRQRVYAGNRCRNEACDK